MYTSVLACPTGNVRLWRNDMKTISVLVPLWEGPAVATRFPSQRISNAVGPNKLPNVSDVLYRDLTAIRVLCQMLKIYIHMLSVRNTQLRYRKRKNNV